MKHVPILAAIGLGIILLMQNGSDAGPSVTPRTVPIIVQGVMQPSKMVALVHVSTGEIDQVVIPLNPGQVFILTSWSAPTAGQWTIYEGPENLAVNRRDRRPQINTGDSVSQHTFPTGIRFPRDAAGMADLYLHALPSPPGGAAAFVQGYITDDF